MARRDKIVKICKHCGNYINDKSRVKHILSDAEDALIKARRFPILAFKNLTTKTAEIVIK